MKRLLHRSSHKNREEGTANGRKLSPGTNAGRSIGSEATQTYPLPERLTPRNHGSPSLPPPTPCPDPRTREPPTTPVATKVDKKDYWQLAIDKLKEEEPSVASQIAAVQEAATVSGSTDFAAQLFHVTTQSQQALEAKRWKITTRAGEVVLRDRLSRLLKAVTVFKDVGNAAASLDPVHAGLPLAGFCLLMQTATNDLDQYAAMVAGVEEVVTIVTRYHQIEAIYLQSPQTALKHDFEQHLISIYKHIVRYQISATNYYRRNTTLRFLRAIPKLDDVSDAIAAIRADDAACGKISQVFDSLDARGRHQELLEKLDRLQPRSQPDSGSFLQTGHAHWTVARVRNTLFIGRDSRLQGLEAVVLDAVRNPLTTDQCRIVVSGMGGQGKSEICLQLAHRVRQAFWGVFWVDVSTVSTAENDFLTIASTLGFHAQSLEEARQGLANVKRSWLLVLDNADDPEVDYQHYFPAGPSSVVMLTSRNVECHRYASAPPVVLEELSDADARALLLRAAGVALDRSQTFQDDAQDVACLLRSHPLALIQAGAYVLRGHCTLAEYPRVYERQRKRLLEFRPAQAQSRYRDVYATFEASAYALRASQTEAAQDALQLLPVLAACAASRLPMPLFEAGWNGAHKITSNAARDDDLLRLTPWHVSHLPPLIQADDGEWDSFRLVEAVSLLKAFSLVSTDTHDGYLSVSMHPLIHAWARDRQNASQQHQSWVMAGCLVSISAFDTELWRIRARQLQPHLQTLTSLEIGTMFKAEPPVMITCVVMNCGELLHNMRDDAKLFVLMQSLFIYLGLDRSTVDPRWLAIYDLTARNLVDYGRVKEAIPLLKQVVMIHEQSAAEDNHDRLTSQRVLAMAYHNNGQVKEAVLLLQKVVAVQEQTLVESHPNQLASQVVLAMTYQMDGRVKKAVSLLQKVVEQILAESHPNQLASQAVLAMAYQMDGRVKEAVSLLQKVVTVQEHTLAESHPNRLASQHALAMAYQMDGRVKEAVSLLQKVVTVQEHTLAESHPNRLASQQVLATLYWELGDHNTAFQMMKHVVEIRRQVLNHDHPNLTNSEGWLEYIEREMSKIAPAEP